MAKKPPQDLSPKQLKKYLERKMKDMNPVHPQFGGMQEQMPEFGMSPMDSMGMPPQQMELPFGQNPGDDILANYMDDNGQLSIPV